MTVISRLDDARVINVNDSFTQISGFSREEIIGKTTLDINLWKNPEERIGFINQLRQKGYFNNFEIQFQRKDGCLRTGLLSARTTILQGMRVSISTTYDITERKQVEVALNESKALTEAIVESTSDLIWSVDPENFGLLTFNYGLSDYFLRGRGMTIQAGMRPEDLFPPGEFVQKWREFYQRALECSSYSIEYSTYSGTVTLLLTFNLLKRDKKVFGISVFGRDITSSKQAEAVVTETKQLYESIFRLSPEAIILTTEAEGRYLAVSDAHERLTGYTPEEVIGHTVSEFGVWENGSVSRQEVIEKLLAEGSVRNVNTRFHRKSGETFFAEISMARVEVGGEQCLVSILSDITERMQSEKFLKDIIANNPMSIQVFDKDGFLLEANPAQKNLFGSVPPSDYSIFNDQQLTQQGMGEIFDKLRNGEEVHFPDVRFNAHDSVPEMPDVPVWVRTIGFPLCDSNDIPERFILMHENISEHKLAEEAHRASEKKYRELFQVNKDGIAIFLLNPYGPPTTFVEVNDAAPRMLGYTREEMLQLTPMMLEPYTTQELLRSRQSEMKLKGILDFETILLHKQGHPIYTEFTAQVIQYEGKPAVMNIVRDVTERKQREKELQAIASLSAALRNAPTRTEMLPVIVEQVTILLNCETVSIEVIDPLTGDAVTEAAKGTWEALIGRHQKSGTGINAIISQSRQSYITNDLKNDSNLAYPEWTQNNIHGGAGVPLIAQNKLIGYLWMGRTTEIVESEVRLLSSVANIAANAIHRATLYEQTQIDTAELKSAYDTTLEGWVNALELRDQETEGHARNVVQMTSDLARALGFPEDELEHVRRGALLHDIGKMGIPDSVLLKPGTLNDREWEIMRRHPEYAYKLLEPIEYLRPVLDIPYCHHEKWDGSGYPRGLKGEEIPLSARVFAIVDVWDALMSDRPYRKAWSHEQSMKHIQGQAGKHFDPKVVAAFLAMMDGQIQSKTPSP